MRLVVVLAALGGCGRVGFSERVTDSGAGDSATTDLVAWYTFDSDPAGTLVDATAHHLDGTCAPASTCPVAIAGIHGMAMQFDGIDDRFVIQDPGALQLRTGFTTSLWLMASTIIDTTVISKPLATGVGASFELVSRPAGLTFFSQDGASETYIMGPMLAPNTWTHVVMSWDGTTRRLYVDGVEAGNSLSTHSFDATPLQIGCDLENGTPNAFFPGAIDEIRIYDRALTASEVAQLP